MAQVAEEVSVVEATGVEHVVPVAELVAKSSLGAEACTAVDTADMIPEEW